VNTSNFGQRVCWHTGTVVETVLESFWLITLDRVFAGMLGQFWKVFG
jgi:hypothetical protein